MAGVNWRAAVGAETNPDWSEHRVYMRHRRWKSLKVEVVRAPDLETAFVMVGRTDYDIVGGSPISNGGEIF